MLEIKKDYIVQKRNVLNEIRSQSMTIQELRFFSIYLSKINKDDPSTRVVRFSVSDFQVIMELERRIKIDYLKRVTDGLLCKVVNVPNERGGYTGFQLFKECIVDVDENGEWYVEIDAHDSALPLMFEFKNRFFSYRLWNALRLKSSNQLRMYEILKQYENLESRILEINELKELLGIDKHEYRRFNNFKSRVLDACEKALEENTDIKFTYEPHGKKGKSGKVLFLKFTIEKNGNYRDPLELSKFIDEGSLLGEYECESDKIGVDWAPDYKEKMIFLADACNGEFSIHEIVVLYDEMKKGLPYSVLGNENECFDYLKHKYNEMIMLSDKKTIDYRFSYLRRMIQKDLRQ